MNLLPEIWSKIKEHGGHIILKNKPEVHCKSLEIKIGDFSKCLWFNPETVTMETALEVCASSLLEEFK